MADFEQIFKSVDDTLRKDSGCTSELDYTEQSSWLLFLKYLDVLAFISFDASRLTRQQRADHARTKVAGEVDDKARAFIDFVLSHYVKEGFEELWLDRLGPLLELRHDSLHEGLAAIGMGASDAREVFVSFQKHLYEISST